MIIIIIIIIIIITIIIIFIYSLQFSTSALADGLSLGSEWQQVPQVSMTLLSTWPFWIMLLFGWSSLVLQLPSPPVPLIIISLLYQNTNQN